MNEPRDPKPAAPTGDRDEAGRDPAPGRAGGGDEDAMERADRANGEPDAVDE